MHQKILAYSFAILIAVAVLRLAGPHSASAVVNELTLTGMPPNTVVTLTNETGEK